ncbi:CCA tRNA nucleotidyltransferase [Falsirhodobacter sp. alg1]|uniref:CCA tRNA nucleotidyltransferase n=1 Tax=Falsirhodobacter sp. alg1 TaxID=1472418 RepID=UPI0005EF2B9E|nr:CCA tRNA nucleotidyltransferase [Falsirhodobacter sp. alg1]
MQIAGSWMGPALPVMAALGDGGYHCLFVGGCVRNALMGLAVGDLDLATDAPPEVVMARATAAGLRVVPTGLEHGTVTVISDGVPCEVTTFRRDVETDGRHATVAFSTDIAEDAARRDFTMNALYADAGGMVIDPLGGLDDLQARRVRFVGDPARRLAEDHLRLLRFFRFHAIYGDAESGIDMDGYVACAAAVDGLDALSRERVGAEMKKLLAAADPAPAVAAMAACGALMRVLPGADATTLAVLVHLEGGRAPDPIRRLALLGGTADLRLSRAEMKRVALTATAAREGVPIPEVAYRHGVTIACDAALVRGALIGTPVDLAGIEDAAAAVCPVTAADLMPGLSGKALGERLRQIEATWIASGFRLGRDALLG